MSIHVVSWVLIFHPGILGAAGLTHVRGFEDSSDPNGFASEFWMDFYRGFVCSRWFRNALKLFATDLFTCMYPDGAGTANFEVS